MAFCGFFTLPVIPLGYSFSVELTYPVSEAMSNGIMVLVSQIVGTSVTYLGGYLSHMNEDGPMYVIGLFAVQITIGFLASLMIVEDLRRVNLSKKTEEEDPLIKGSEKVQILP